MAAVHLLIKGRVQGVYYRASAQAQAAKLGITGWVKNTAAGHVEAVACGNKQQLDAFIAWCRQGPPGAHVTELETQNVEDVAMQGFQIHR
ncbi:acylphosphatase [Foetidibacter luteolus]|uniref:acylphosphatase n=1 Tax=Foetidibacter luteolus TaxID=2608880 RepID=UPI00129BE9DD|nr:acylphosphatase [Foetidibacter luteolus]